MIEHSKFCHCGNCQSQNDPGLFGRTVIRRHHTLEVTSVQKRVTGIWEVKYEKRQDKIVLQRGTLDLEMWNEMVKANRLHQAGLA